MRNIFGRCLLYFIIHFVKFNDILLIGYFPFGNLPGRFESKLSGFVEGNRMFGRVISWRGEREGEGFGLVSQRITYLRVRADFVAEGIFFMVIS